MIELIATSDITIPGWFMVIVGLLLIPLIKWMKSMYDSIRTIENALVAGTKDFDNLKDKASDHEKRIRRLERGEGVVRGNE